jgi:ABC-type multidrug transport system ATPase subunit
MPATCSSHVHGSPVLVLEDVSRRYGDQVALAPVTLTAERGSVAVLLGENGAGKSTLLRIASGLLRPSSGSRRCGGRAVYLRPGSGARSAQRLGDVIAFAARAAGSQAGVDELLARVGLEGLERRRVGTLSTGQRARLCVALAAASVPVVACLDEPTASLDDQGREDTARAIRALAAAGTAVLVATHDDELVRGGWDAVVRLRAGSVLA